MMKVTWVKVLFFLFSFVGVVGATENVYNLSLSGLPAYRSLVFEVRSGWGTRYTPPTWAEGYELWSGFNYGINEKFSGQVFVGYNFSSGDPGISVGVGYNIYRKGPLALSTMLLWMRETTGDFTLQNGVFVSYKMEAWEFLFNNYLEKTFASDRDPMDWHVTLSASRKMGILRVGVEYLGEDLEDVWEEEEAEGGANNFIGVLMSVGTEKFGVSLTPGYSLGPRPGDKNSMLVLAKIWLAI